MVLAWWQSHCFGRSGKEHRTCQRCHFCWGGGEQPIKLVLVNALREECNNFKKGVGTWAEFLEHGGGEGKLDRSRKALVVVCLKHVCSPVLPFPGVPLVLICHSGK